MGRLRGYRQELPVLLVVAVVLVGLGGGVDTQDETRLGLTQAIVDHGTLQIDRFQSQTVDKAVYGGHYYTDKAPGISFLAVPWYGLVRALGLVPQRYLERGVWHSRPWRWFFRFLTVGVFYVLGVFLVGRLAETLRPGSGALSAATFGLGTLALPLGDTIFSHVTSGALALAAFALLWPEGAEPRGRREVAAGACLGAAFVVEYQAAILVALLCVYALFRTRRPATALHLLAGLAPFLGLLGAYDAIAFGSPFRLSYHYVSATYTEEMSNGLFGIGAPRAASLERVLFSHTGLLTRSPVLLLALAGLVLMWRRGARAESLVCCAATVSFFFLEIGYYKPFGGYSPGARFFVPALPFLVLGLADAFDRWPRLTLLVAGASIVSVTRIALMWSGFRFFLVRMGEGPLNALLLLLAAGAVVLAASPLRARLWRISGARA